MPRIDNEKFYTASYKLHGISAKGLNWNSEESQKKRFEVLLGMLPQEIQNYTVADAGCGFGDLYLYMQERGKVPQSYVGIDSLETMCALTQERTACQVLHADICRDSLPKADFYLCSGALNNLTEFETFLFMRNCFMACTQGFVFNVLYGTKKSATYNYMTRQKIEQIAEDLKASSLTFEEGYLANDISVSFSK